MGKSYKIWRETGQLASCCTGIYIFFFFNLIHRFIEHLLDFVFMDFRHSHQYQERDNKSVRNLECSECYQKIKTINEMKKHFVDNHASCDKGKDVIQHLKIDLESLSEVIIKSYFISEL